MESNQNYFNVMVTRFVHIPNLIQKLLLKFEHIHYYIRMIHCGNRHVGTYTRDGTQIHACATNNVDTKFQEGFVEKDVFRTNWK